MILLRVFDDQVKSKLSSFLVLNNANSLNQTSFPSLVSAFFFFLFMVVKCLKMISYRELVKKQQKRKDQGNSE